VVEPCLQHLAAAGLLVRWIEARGHWQWEEVDSVEADSQLGRAGPSLTPGSSVEDRRTRES